MVVTVLAGEAVKCAGLGGGSETSYTRKGWRTHGGCFVVDVLGILAAIRVVAVESAGNFPRRNVCSKKCYGLFRPVPASRSIVTSLH